MQRVILTFLTLLSGLTLYSQSSYINSNPFFEYYKEELMIDMEDGKPYVTIYTDLEILYPSDMAAQRLPYYVIMLSSYDELGDVDVIIRNSRGRKTYLDAEDFEISEGSSEDYFVNGSKEYKINFKNLEAGSRVSISYNVTTNELHYFQPMYMRLFLYTRDLEYTISYPEDMKVRFVEKNFKGVKITEGEGNRKGRKLKKYMVGNQESVEVFEDGPSISYYTPHVIPIIQTYKYNGVTHPYLRSPDDLYHWYDSIVYLRGEETSPELKSIAQDILSESSAKEDIIKNTYQWVQKNIRYVAYEAGADGIIPRSPKKVCQRKFGDCKDMSNLMRKLLKLNGIESNLTWIGTRRIPYTYEDVYTMNTDNHMILAVPKVDKKWTLLDATDPNGIFGLPTTGIQGKQAMISLDHQNYDLYLAPVVSAEENALEYTIDMQVDGTTMKLQTELHAKGLNAGKIKNIILYTSEREREQLMKGLLTVNSNTTELVESQVKEENQDLKILTEHEVDGRVKKVSNYYFIDPYVNRILPFGKIETEDRTIPVEITMNQLLTNTIQIHIPEGYEVSKYPEPIEIMDADFTYKLLPEVKEKTLVIKEILRIDTDDLFFSLKTANAWNDLMTEVKNLYKTPIKLEKK